MNKLPAVVETPSLSLFKMLQVARPHDSLFEQRFAQTFLYPLELKTDKFGNLYKWVGESKVVWASHVDTAHTMGGDQFVTREGTKFKLSKHSVSSCLGGDDTCGVWLMTEMIKANVPGLYIFHRGEEKGCLGSSYVVAKCPHLVKGGMCVISLDRRSTKSVITYQRGWRCCSDDFGKSLAGAIGMKHELDQGGLYTDSAKYTDLIGECTNVSVGFDNEHSKNESVDVDYLFKLRESLLSFDESKLVFKRKPGEQESRWKTSYTRGGGWAGEYDDDWWGAMYGYGRPYGERSNGGFDYKKQFYGGYFDAAKRRWVALTREEWEAWAGKTPKKKKTNHRQTPMMDLIQKNLGVVSRLIEDTWQIEVDIMETLIGQRKEREQEEREAAAARAKLGDRVVEFKPKDDKCQDYKSATE